MLSKYTFVCQNSALGSKQLVEGFSREWVAANFNMIVVDVLLINSCFELRPIKN